MEVVKKLNVPATFFYEKVIESVVFDIEQQIGETVTVEELKGFEYSKAFDQVNRGTIKIEENIVDQAYYFRTITARNDFFVKYDIKKLSETTCEVTYYEKIDSTNTSQQMNDWLLSMMFGFSKKKKIKQMLQSIEAMY